MHSKLLLLFVLLISIFCFANGRADSVPRKPEAPPAEEHAEAQPLQNPQPKAATGTTPRYTTSRQPPPYTTTRRYTTYRPHYPTECWCDCCIGSNCIPSRQGVIYFTTNNYCTQYSCTQNCASRYTSCNTAYPSHTNNARCDGMILNINYILLVAAFLLSTAVFY